MYPEDVLQDSNGVQMVGLADWESVSKYLVCMEVKMRNGALRCVKHNQQRKRCCQRMAVRARLEGRAGASSHDGT